MPDLEDVQGYQKELDRELDKLDQFDDADLDPVKRWIHRTDGRVATSTMATYLRNLRSFAVKSGAVLVVLDEGRLDDSCYDLAHEHELANDTIRNMQFAVRKFLRFVHRDEDGHWSEDYPLRPPSEPKVDPDDVLIPEDINAMRDAANCLRNIALIEFFADTGARLALAMSLRVGDVDVDSDTPTYSPNPDAMGLKGAEVRAYPLVDSHGVIRTYLAAGHPRSRDPDVALFHKRRGFDGDDGAVDPNVVRKQLKDIADRAGIDKPANPHNFRHTAITRMRREGYDRGEIEHRVHWDVDTDMWERYEHISAEQHNESIFEKAGFVESADDGPSQVRDRCGNCFEPVAPHHHRCPRCGSAVSKDAREAMSGAISEGAEMSTTVSEPQAQVTATEVVQALAREGIVVVPDGDHAESSSD